LFERPQSGERAILVHASTDGLPDESERAEFAELARSAGAAIASELLILRRRPDARFFIGKGKLAELKTLIGASEADLVISSAALSPSQERNLERELRCRVLDRAGLILDIFAQRARSFEGKLQVELAQLRHLSTRLVRGWTHLERQKGGIGLRGPGETQLETDRRLLGKRIKYLNNRLVKVSRQRAQSRQARKKAQIPTVSLVGYTNAGKSTLFNALTNSSVHTADALFATLDPTLRKFEISNELCIILADTVGFIRHLPHDLVAAFRATLLETREADLILHVVDCADDNKHEKMQAVNQVMEEIGAKDVPQLLIYNKIDIPGYQPRIDNDEAGIPNRVWLSAISKAGFDELYEVLQTRFSDQKFRYQLTLHPDEGRILAYLHAEGAIEQEIYENNGDINLNLVLSAALLEKLYQKFQLSDARVQIQTNRLAGVA